MRWFSNLLKACALLLLLLALVAFLLPGERSLHRSLDIQASPQQLWPLLVEPQRWSVWSPWHLKDPAMRQSFSGPAAGVGAQWNWESSIQGRGRMHIDEAEDAQRLVYTLHFEDMGQEARGAITLQPLDGGMTRVDWSFSMRLGHNPVMRWFGLGLDTLVGRDYEIGLKRLAEQSGSKH